MSGIAAEGLHPFDVPGLRFSSIDEMVPGSGVVSTSIRNSLRRERKLRSRDDNVCWRGNTDKSPPRPLYEPIDDTGEEPKEIFGMANNSRNHSSSDPDLGDHRPLEESLRNLVDPSEQSLDNEVDPELELLMATNGGFDPSERQWLRWDHRDADPDMLVVGTTDPSVRCWAITA